MEKDIPALEVQRMARLSRLIINHDEEVVFARQFGQILGHMAVLETLDTTDVEPLYSPATAMAPLRMDLADNIRSHEEIMANAPETDGEYFIVPRIV